MLYTHFEHLKHLCVAHDGSANQEHENKNKCQ